MSERSGAPPERSQETQIFAGPGNNGGDGIALARRLHTRGYPVHLSLSHDPDKYKGDAATNLHIAQQLNIPISTWPSGPLPSGDLLIDALLGTGADRPVEGALADIVGHINEQRARGAQVLAIDIPTGLDCDAGEPLGEAVIRADRTITLAGLKQGFADPRSREYTGVVHIGDIGALRTPGA